MPPTCGGRARKLVGEVAVNGDGETADRRASGARAGDTHSTLFTLKNADGCHHHGAEATPKLRPSVAVLATGEETPAVGPLGPCRPGSACASTARGETP